MSKLYEKANKLTKEDKQKLSDELLKAYKETLTSLYTIVTLHFDYDLKPNPDMALYNIRHSGSAYLFSLELELVRLQGRKWCDTHISAICGEVHHKFLDED